MPVIEGVLIDLDEDRSEAIRQELVDDGHDLPELAETMGEADARATADSYLRALGLIMREMGANDAEHRTLQSYYANRHASRQGMLDRSATYLRGRIEALFGFMKLTGKKKSLNLLGGRVGMRAKQDELVVEDDEAVIAWATGHGWQHMVRKKPTLDRKALRAHMETRAHMEPREAEKADPFFPPPPGVSLKERPDEFYASPAAD